MLESRNQSLQVPAHLDAKVARPIRFRLSLAGSSATFGASNLPVGAVLDSSSGDFQWTPDLSQQGSHSIAFTAVDPTGDSVTARSIIDVDAGTPVIVRVVNAASRSEDAVCSPGAIGRVEGRWLTDGPPVSDPTGYSRELSGTAVRINGAAVPILSASQSRVDFLCPAAAPGLGLEIALKTANAVAQPIQAVSRQVAPGLFSVDESGKGQGVVMHAGTTTMAMVPNYRYSSRTALPGDLLTIYATGIENAPDISVALGEIEVSPLSVAAVPGIAGVYQLNVILPDGVNEEDIPVSLKIRMLDGSTVTSNKVLVAIETSR
jgi:uncharacterized protein (TIGR03437 family)